MELLLHAKIMVAQLVKTFTVAVLTCN